MDPSKSSFLYGSPTSSEDPELLVKQNQDLRRRLEDETLNYKRRLETYRQAQQHQAALVSRLQAKVCSLIFLVTKAWNIQILRIFVCLRLSINYI